MGNFIFFSFGFQARWFYCNARSYFFVSFPFVPFWLPWAKNRDERKEPASVPCVENRSLTSTVLNLQFSTSEWTRVIFLNRYNVFSIASKNGQSRLYMIWGTAKKIHGKNVSFIKLTVSNELLWKWLCINALFTDKFW